MLLLVARDLGQHAHTHPHYTSSFSLSPPISLLLLTNTHACMRRHPVTYTNTAYAATWGRGRTRTSATTAWVDFLLAGSDSLALVIEDVCV
jgi:hypothetical protein